MVKNTEKLKAIGFDITLHDKMPDVVLYKEDEKLALFYRGGRLCWSNES